MRTFFREQRGQLSVGMLFIAALVVTLMTGFLFLSITFLQFSTRSFNKAQAFAIAEAGIEYYRWHLAHAPDDFHDGTGGAGPYVHTFYDKDGNAVGTFTLTITPPMTGSTVVTVRSTGVTFADPSIQKIIQVKLAVPSFARYAIAANDTMRFGVGTEVFGEIISNGGIRFDGIAHNLVSSALTAYDDPDHSGPDEFAVHTHVNPVDPVFPAAVPDRPDVFFAGRVFPVPAIDFAGMTQDLSSIRSSASSSGVYATSSGAYGFDLVLNASGTYSLYRVTALRNTGGSCRNSQNQTGWGSWSIQNETLIKTGPFPSNGLFFFEDHVWVRGTINGARLTIASGKFPDNQTTRTSITVNQDLRYTNYDGRDVISLIAQNNIHIGLYSNDVLRIDAALIAQNGRIGRYYYGSGCSPYHVRSSITSYGMLGTSQRYGFAYTDSTGYTSRNLVYDANLLYGPPPSFPLAASQYSLISWEEVQ
ncbi:MAG: hypothetical protein RIQ54_408 [Candidatus Parcubacteria bacterium]|jgi:hypothetical protein